MPNKVKITNQMLNAHTGSGDSSKVSTFISKQKIGKIELYLKERIKFILDFERGKYEKYSDHTLEYSKSKHIGELIGDLSELIKRYDFDSVLVSKRKTSLGNMKSVGNFKMESKKTPSAQEVGNWYDIATDKSGYNPNFDVLTTKVFGDWFAPDISAYFDAVKNKPDGNERFVKYITHHRPNNRIYMAPEKNPKEPTNRQKLENYIKKIVKEMLEK